MKTNMLTILVNKPISEVFRFAITPPNSTLWIPGIVGEETNEWPVKAGTIYTLKNKNGEKSEVVVVSIEKDKMVEWVSKDQSYHCRYTFKQKRSNSTELVYYEWVDVGDLEEQFTLKVLEDLKTVLEK